MGDGDRFGVCVCVLGRSPWETRQVMVKQFLISSQVISRRSAAEARWNPSNRRSSFGGLGVSLVNAKVPVIILFAVSLKERADIQFKSTWFGVLFIGKQRENRS